MFMIIVVGASVKHSMLKLNPQSIIIHSRRVVLNCIVHCFMLALFPTQNTIVVTKYKQQKKEREKKLKKKKFKDTKESFHGKLGPCIGLFL